MTNLPKHPFDWSVLNSSYPVRDRWITLRADTCQMPSGKLIDPFYVLEAPEFVNVVAITPRGEVVLVREYRHGIARTILELPSGAADSPAEPPLEVARRELLEETGYSGAEFTLLSTLSPNPARYNNRVYSYLAQNVERVQDLRLDPAEQIEVILLPIAQVLEMLLTNQFLQAMHSAALFYAFVHLGMINANDSPRP